MKIAVIGSGISGLTAAHVLSRAHDVQVFESNSYIGGHTNTIDVELDGEQYAVDTGFIVFNERNYPNFTRLLHSLGVASKPTSMSFSVRCDATGLEYNGTSLNALFAQRLNLIRLRFWKMIVDILRFNREAPRVLLSGGDELSVGEYVRRGGYGSTFVNNYLVPLGASLWSCPTQTFERFPVRFVVEFLSNHAMMQIGGRPVWRVVHGGSRQYIPPLTEGFSDRIRLNCPVRRITRHGSHVRLEMMDGATEVFDHVVVACHADTALRILTDVSQTEQKLLSAFPYQPNEAILHTDTSVLPRREMAWASWNYRVLENSSKAATVTYNMNMLQGIESDHTFCVTLNDDDEIDPGKILRRIQYHHPVFSSGRHEAQARHYQIVNHRRTSFCGAYWGYGFHEDGVNSALAVCKTFGMEL